jgi:hypothetical protein
VLAATSKAKEAEAEVARAKADAQRLAAEVTRLRAEAAAAEEGTRKRKRDELGDPAPVPQAPPAKKRKAVTLTGVEIEIDEAEPHVDAAEKMGIAAKMASHRDAPACWNCFAALAAGDPNDPERSDVGALYIHNSWLYRVQGEAVISCDFCKSRVCDVVYGITFKIPRKAAELVVVAAGHKASWATPALVYKLLSSPSDALKARIAMFSRIYAKRHEIEDPDVAVALAQTNHVPLTRDEARWLLE